MREGKEGVYSLTVACQQGATHIILFSLTGCSSSRFSDDCSKGTRLFADLF